ncbi:aldo/keto reductase [Rhodohalobacter sulfatireducens]|uniref:Aldo/keto reductase n=1 Tax=Rhodohalobacter sulfatireducens TaxID=2911366 RepID=A0ABS9KAM4_9BACT|nr:aldo/keto reductase [Rhodohalobacter sulfatireducens]MCG2587894.1 aldo/keto reductase [Rhodohalobacter sulfatireducens]
MTQSASNRIKLHNNGPEFSKLAAGFWRLNEWDMSTAELIDFIENCLEMGITTMDHADIYGDYQNEGIFGEALKKRPDLREKMEIVSKCGICLPVESRPEHKLQHYNTTAEHIRKSVENSLKELNTDYLDLILIHRPDPLMDASEMADIFMKLHEEGKIKHVGVSNFTTSQFQLFQSKLDLPLVTNQVECSLLHLHAIYDGTFDQCQENNISPMLWSPFAGGQLFNGSGKRIKRIRKVGKKLCRKYDVEFDQLSLAWCFYLPFNPLTILGTGKKARVKKAANALNIKLERQDWFRLLEASRGEPVP